MYQECDCCGAKIGYGPYRAIALHLADTEEETVFCFCCRKCRRAFERDLKKVIASEGFNLVELENLVLILRR